MMEGLLLVISCRLMNLTKSSSCQTPNLQSGSDRWSKSEAVECIGPKWMLINRHFNASLIHLIDHIPIVIIKDDSNLRRGITKKASNLGQDFLLDFWRYGLGDWSEFHWAPSGPALLMQQRCCMLTERLLLKAYSSGKICLAFWPWLEENFGVWMLENLKTPYIYGLLQCNTDRRNLIANTCSRKSVMESHLLEK